MQEKELIQLILDGTRPEYAFNQLVKTYSERLYWLIRKMSVSHEDTNDILQNVFIKVWNNLAEFRGESKLYTWLYRIATNETLSFFKRNKSGETESLEANQTAVRAVADDTTFRGDELQQYLQEAISLLPEKQRVVFTMRYYDETRFEDLAEILNTSSGALKASYHFAAKKVEKYLRDRLELD